MITGKRPVSVVLKKTIVHLIHTIYFDHYLRWYSPFLNDSGAYERQLRERLEEIEKSLGDCEDIEVNGMKMLTPAIPLGDASEPLTRTAVGTALLILLALLVFLLALFAIYRFAARRGRSWA